jgi:Tol biopolymer transport system component
MKKIFLITALFFSGKTAFLQKPAIDTNYATSIVSAEWMPDGKSLLISVIKYHKTKENAAFFSKVYKYDIGLKKLTYLFDNGSNLAPSPDGKTIAFLKRDDNKRTDIYFYNTQTKQETVFKTDTSGKNALSWSPDGKKFVFNAKVSNIKDYGDVEICVLDIATKQIKQITNSGKDKSYSPEWCPDSKRIVYYLEKGDDRDQIWLTDLNGLFHTNLTNDTITHNYFPSWFNENTILYTQSPGTIMMINADGSNRRKAEGLTSEQAKYNTVAGQFVYVRTETGNTVVLYDWKKKTSTILLDGTKIIEEF